MAPTLAEIDPSVAILLSALVTAICTAILRWSAYRWPPGFHDPRASRNKHVKPKGKHGKDEDDDDDDPPPAVTEATNPLTNGPSTY